MATTGYATVGTNDTKRAVAFYDALLTPGGLGKAFDHPSGGRFYGRDGQLVFGVIGPFDKKPASVGNGSMTSFRCDSAAEVDAMHKKALELGGKDEGAPGDRTPNFYMAYFRDLDGNKLCAYWAH